MNLNSLRKILIIRLSSLGDIVLTTPLIRTIKKNYPQIEIDFLTKERYRDALSQNPYLKNLFIYYIGKYEQTKLITKLETQKYDIVIDLQNNPRSNKITSRLIIPNIKFIKRDIDKMLLVYFKINRLKNSPSIPERYASALNDFQLDSNGLDLITDKTASSLFAEDKKYIGFCPGSRHFTKMWPKQYYVDLGCRLIKENYKIVLFGGKEDKAVCEEISSQIPGAVNLSNDDDILQTAADMKKCSAVVCNDSGLMHAACAEKVPVLTFFGSTVKEFGFIPYKNKNIILENNSLSCRPCTHIGKSYCPKGHFKCMLDIDPKTAFNNLNLLIHSK